jgi:CBS domain-containing protein
MVRPGSNIVKRSLEDLGAANKARELGRVVLGLLGRRHSGTELGGSVRSIMTGNVATCSPGDTLHRAAQLMWERDCGAVPVVDGEGRLVGVVTDRDLCMAAFTQGRPLSGIGVGGVLSGRMHTCSGADSVDHAVAILRTQRIRRLVVVDGTRKVVGMLALADVARYVATLGPARRDAALVFTELLATLSERPLGTAAVGHAAE